MTSSAILPDSIIVAVDDDHDDADLLRILLRKAGLSNPVEIFREGEQLVTSLSKLAQSSLKTLRPLLCFLDIKMPSMTGHDVLRWIRAQPALDRLPVVMLSSSEHPRDVQQAAQNGAQCYLTKYPQPAVLKEVVEEAHRFVAGTPAEECFCMPANQLLVRGRRLRPQKPLPMGQRAP
jgi:CheY-like chemotaxis protein